MTITGTNLTGATVVKFNTTNATAYTVNSATQITATVPAGATTGPVSVTTPGGTDAGPTFTVIQPPTVTSFLPTSGPVGASVTITGTNLTGATVVKFNTTNATAYTVNSATQITATVPAGATTGPVSVTTPGGTDAGPTFTVIPPPTVVSFTPAIGKIGTSVTITGTNLTGATVVKFNGTTAAIGTNTAASIATTVPAGATTGPITVTTAGGTDTSSADFTVDDTPPVLTGPGNLTVEADGPGGTRVSFTVSASDGTPPVALLPGAITCNPASPAQFPLGTQSVTCTATDAAGNVGQLSFTVTVRDTHAAVDQRARRLVHGDERVRDLALRPRHRVVPLEDLRHRPRLGRDADDDYSGDAPDRGHEDRRDGARRRRERITEDGDPDRAGAGQACAPTGLQATGNGAGGGCQVR